MYDEYLYKDEDGNWRVNEDAVVDPSPELVNGIVDELWKRTRQEVHEMFEETEKVTSEALKKGEEVMKRMPLMKLKGRVIDLRNEIEKYPERKEELLSQIDDLKLQIEEMEKKEMENRTVQEE